MVSGLKGSLLGLALLGACLASPALAQSVGKRVDLGAFALEALPPQRLAPKVCGVFLWSKTEQPVFVMVARNEPAEAVVQIDGRSRVLKRTAFAGQPLYGHFDQETYQEGDLTIALDLAFERNGKLKDGATLQSGVMRVTRGSGDVGVVPVGGLLACKT